MAERIAAGLRPDREAVRLEADRDAPDLAGCRVDVVDHIAEPTRQPKPLPVGCDVAHIGAAATGDGPALLDRASREIDNRDAASTVRRRARRVRAAVGDVEPGRVATGIEPM